MLTKPKYPGWISITCGWMRPGWRRYLSTVTAAYCRSTSAIQKLTGTGRNLFCPAVSGSRCGTSRRNEVSFPYAGEWLTEDEIRAVLDAVRDAVCSVCYRWQKMRGVSVRR